MMIRNLWETILIMVLVMKSQVLGIKVKRIIKKLKQCKWKISSVKINLMNQEMASHLNQSRKDNLWWQTKPKYLILQIRSLKVAVFSALERNNRENFLLFNLESLKHGLGNSSLVVWNDVPMLTRKSKKFFMNKKKIKHTANSLHANRCSPIRKTLEAGS